MTDDATPVDDLEVDAPESNEELEEPDLPIGDTEPVPVDESTWTGDKEPEEN